MKKAQQINCVTILRKEDMYEKRFGNFNLCIVVARNI